ncbi:hypothetical protein CABS03_13206 [Colletotrichum abscissum]|uniref:Uncharacterized protein n=1 Tax=Colletotrichum abscissum TaxID=1671311 RepID=A0A9P9XCU3_9PEZI|nr:hypothetical protein CABS02_08108 [Colletotrichum abscissum]
MIFKTSFFQANIDFSILHQALTTHQSFFDHYLFSHSLLVRHFITVQNRSTQLEGNPHVRHSRCVTPLLSLLLCRSLASSRPALFSLIETSLRLSIARLSTFAILETSPTSTPTRSLTSRSVASRSVPPISLSLRTPATISVLPTRAPSSCFTSSTTWLSTTSSSTGPLTARPRLPAASLSPLTTLSAVVSL